MPREDAMTAPAAAAPGEFAAAARCAVTRLTLAEWLRLLRQTALPVFALVLAGWLLLLRWGGGVRDEEPWWAFVPVALWLAAAALVAWRRRPGPFAALAVWDRAANRREMFASAWFFENTGATAPGAKLHLALARESLGDRGRLLRRDLPLRLHAHVWIAPLLFFAVVFSGVLRAPIPPEDRELTADTRERAGEIGKSLAERAEGLRPLPSLSEEERKKLEELREELKRAAGTLKDTTSPRNLLESLEQAARETEKLADSLRGSGGDTGALSSAFLSELERNADTADLGNALRAHELGRAAEEAQAIEERLGQRKPTLEETKRLEEALKRALEAASKKDLESEVARRLAEAMRQLAGGNHGGAAGQFAALRQGLIRAAQRRLTQAGLRQLAQNFRGAGQRILGGQNLQRLGSGSAPSLASLPVLPPGSGSPGLPLPNLHGAGASVGLPIPGLPTASARGSGSAAAFPVPGSAGNLNPGGNQSSAGTGAPIPIPGAGRNPGGTMAAVGGAFPIPGSGNAPGAGGGGMNGALAGGSQAGRGTAPLGANQPTTPPDATESGVVAPAPGAEGPSAVRAVAGGPHRETATRSRREIAIDFLKTEEAALADEPLPNSRREQVLRYFTAIRQELERQP